MFTRRNQHGVRSTHGFGFAARRSTSSLVRRRACEFSRSEIPVSQVFDIFGQWLTKIRKASQARCFFDFHELIMWIRSPQGRKTLHSVRTDASGYTSLRRTQGFRFPSGSPLPEYVEHLGIFRFFFLKKDRRAARMSCALFIIRKDSFTSTLKSQFFGNYLHIIVYWPSSESQRVKRSIFTFCRRLPIMKLTPYGKRYSPSMSIHSRVLSKSYELSSFQYVLTSIMRMLFS